MRKNVGTLDALFRLTLGFTCLGWGISKMVRFPYRMNPVLITILAACKIAEGITRWCPMLSFLGLSTRDSKKQPARASYRTQNDVQHSVRKSKNSG